MNQIWWGRFVDASGGAGMGVGGEGAGDERRARRDERLMTQLVDVMTTSGGVAARTVVHSGIVIWKSDSTSSR